jgi:hypothetical protein
MERPMPHNICRVRQQRTTHLHRNILNISNPSDLVFCVNLASQRCAPTSQLCLNFPNPSDLVFYVNLFSQWCATHQNTNTLNIPNPSDLVFYVILLKVHKIENFFDSDFGIRLISLLVMSKY